MSLSSSAPAIEVLGAPVFRGISAQSLHRVREPAFGLVLWHRPMSLSLHKSAHALLALPPFSNVAAGAPDAAVRQV
jgi:hypothetical protein